MKNGKASTLPAHTTLGGNVGAVWIFVLMHKTILIFPSGMVRYQLINCRNGELVTINGIIFGDPRKVATYRVPSKRLERYYVL